MSSWDLVFKDLRIMGISNCRKGLIIGSLYASLRDAEEMMNEIDEHPIQVIKRIFDVDEINEAVEISKRGGKIVIEFVKEDID